MQTENRFSVQTLSTQFEIVTKNVTYNSFVDQHLPFFGRNSDAAIEKLVVLGVHLAMIYIIGVQRKLYLHDIKFEMAIQLLPQ